MRATDHTNLNKFLGVSLMGSACLTLWECCSRGNIIVTLFLFRQINIKLMLGGHKAACLSNGRLYHDCND